MRYLKSFESKLKTINYKDMTTWGSTEPIKESKPLDVDYIKLIFSDFFDNGEADIQHNVIERNNQEVVSIVLMDIDNTDRGFNIDDFINQSKRYIEFFENIKSCINKVKDEWSDIEAIFQEDDGYDPISGNMNDKEYSIVFKKSL